MTYVNFNQPSLKSLNSFLDSLLNEVPAPVKYWEQNNGFHFPPVNIFESKDNFELEFNVPGRNKEDFKITVDKNILTVSYEIKEQVTNENKKQIKKEFSLQPFKRTFTLDEKVLGDNIAASYENGLLVLTIPKKEEVKVEAKQIAIK